MTSGLNRIVSPITGIHSSKHPNAVVGRKLSDRLYPSRVIAGEQLDHDVLADRELVAVVPVPAPPAFLVLAPMRPVASAPLDPQ